jgi:hypothetical protein
VWGVRCTSVGLSYQACYKRKLSTEMSLAKLTGEPFPGEPRGNDFLS